MATVIHVNRQHIAMNAKDGLDRPVYTVKRDGEVRYCRAWATTAPVRGIYNGTQLSCGARAWIEVDGDVELIGECSFQEARNAA